VTEEYKTSFGRQRHLMRRTIFISISLYIGISCAAMAAGGDLVRASTAQACGSLLTGVAMPLDGSPLKALPKRVEPCAESGGKEATLTFSGLDLNGTVQTYSESGYTLIGRAGLKPCDADADCIRAMREPGGGRILAYAGGSINFNLSAKICNPDGKTPTQSIMFVGKFADGRTTAFAVTVRGNSSQDQLFMFPEAFQNLVSVSWIPKGTAVTEIRLAN
jgi:hypothetical protein